MTIEQYVEEILCAPVTRVGFGYLVEAIELVIDTRDHKFYKRLSEIHNTDSRYLEKAMRDSKNLSLEYMEKKDKERIFGATIPTTTEFILHAAKDYRRSYENKKG